MIKKELEIRDILLFLIVVMLGINAFINLKPQRVEADTFKLDDCITTKPDGKPAAYLHVVAN